jgi:uncharacterized membrane protein YfcA
LKKATAFISWLVFAAALVAAPSPAYTGQTVLVAPRAAVVARGPRISRIQNRSVWNDRGQLIGAIADFVVDHDDRLFAVVQVGGFFGVGGFLVAVPFKILVVGQSGRKVVLPGATREALRNYPEFRF